MEGACPRNEEFGVWSRDCTPSTRRTRGHRKTPGGQKGALISMEEGTNEYESRTWRQWHTPVILAIAVVLLVSNIYFYWDRHQLQQRLRRIQNSVESDLQKLRENTASSAQATAKTLEELRTQLDDERGRAMQAAN